MGYSSSPITGYLQVHGWTHFQLFFVSSKLGVLFILFKENWGHFQQVLWWPKPAFFHGNGDHLHLWLWQPKGLCLDPRLLSRVLVENNRFFFTLSNVKMQARTVITLLACFSTTRQVRSCNLNRMTWFCRNVTMVRSPWHSLYPGDCVTSAKDSRPSKKMREPVGHS